MNQARSTDRFLGCRATGIVVTALVIASIIYCAAQEQQHQPAPWLLVLLFVLVGRQARLARARLGADQSWNQAWDAMAGDAPESPAAPRRRGSPLLATLGMVIWLATAGFLSMHAAEPTTPNYAALALCFLALSAYGAWGLLRWLARPRPRRRTREAAAPAPKRDDIVTVCLPVSRTSPSVRRMVPALPDYCLALLQRQGIATATPESPPH